MSPATALLHAPALEALSERIVTAADKGLPYRAVGLSVREFLATSPALAEFDTPLLVLSRSALQANAAVVQGWVEEQGFELMPHGKTTMAPALWQLQLALGASGLTLATPGQVRTARMFGAPAIQLANACVSPPALSWLAEELRDEAFSFACWVDSIETVEAMERVLADARPSRPVEVLVELGARGGRTGARSLEGAVAVARRAAHSPVLRLVGVAGYEGSLAHDRDPASLSRVETYLAELAALAEAVAALGGIAAAAVSIGGSAYLDLVAERFGPLARDGGARVVMRSGASLVHDDGFYQGVSPLDGRLVAAMRGYARVLSHPEPGLALLDAGKRDLPYDDGLPRPLAEGLAHAAVTAVNDQHAYLRADGGLPAAIGDVIALGLSHPCTAFDKWRLVPVVEDHGSPRVVGLVQTFF